MNNLEIGADCDILKADERGKTSPVSLSSVENQSPNSTPRNTSGEQQKNGESTKMTLGQTLKNELRKSSMQLNRKNPQNADKILNNSRNIIKPNEEHMMKSPMNGNSVEEDDSTEEPYLLENENHWFQAKVEKSPLNNTNSGKRRRTRRNPVWKHFDIEQGMAICRHCDYKTKSVFSTNLKVHLKSHHRLLFDQVLESEAGMTPLTLENVQKNTVNPSDLNKNNLQYLLKKMNENTDAERTNAELLAALTSANPQSQSSMKTLSNILNNSNNKTSATEQMPTLNAVLGASSSVSPTSGTSSLISNNSAPGKRKRLRRHPVWKFFRDTVGCTMCLFKTHSAFSTNLKMHLKAHHKIEYVEVMEMELETANTETENAASGIRNPLGKRPRKTAEEIKYMIEKCKNNLDKEREKRSLLCAGNNSNNNSANTSLNFDFNLLPENISSIFDQADVSKTIENLSATEQLNAMIGLFVQQQEGIFILNFIYILLATINGNDDSKVVEEKSLIVEEKNQDINALDMALVTAIEKCKKADQTDKLISYRGEMKKEARDLAMAMLMETDSHLLEKDAFKLLVYTLAPEYKLPSE